MSDCSVAEPIEEQVVCGRNSRGSHTAAGTADARSCDRASRHTFFNRTITSIALISVPSGAGILKSGTHSSGMSESSSVSSR